MYFITIMLCALVLSVIQLRQSVNCHPLAVKNVGDASRKIRIESALDDKLGVVTRDDNTNAIYVDNANNTESPEASQEAPPYQQLFNNFDSAYKLYESSEDEEPECILARSEFYLSWWVDENGSLRLPAFNRLNTSGILDLSLQFDSENSIFQHVLNFTSDNPHEVIRFMSVASNKLDQIPASVLNLTSASIQYLSLAGNNFYDLFDYGENSSFHNFTSFPLMTQLLELDLRNCHITSLTSAPFENLPKLDKLFLSHNHFIVIRAAALKPLRHLRHLDISYNEIEPRVANRIGGMIFEDSLFADLEHLMFLDLSYSPLNRGSFRTLRSLGPEMKQLSLCHTGMTVLEEGLLDNTTLNVLDLSGNVGLSRSLRAEDLSHLEDSLEIFVFRDAQVSDFELTASLRKLRMIDLRNNSLTYLQPDAFAQLADLEILDLGSNVIDNWNERVFTANARLRILNLRTNNITGMREGMLNDFYEIRYLAIGSNDFECACNLRDFIDRATRNALYHYCSDRSKRSVLENLFNSPEHQYNVFLREFHTIVAFYEDSYRNMIVNSPLMARAQSINSTRQRSMGIDAFSEKDCYNFDSEEQTHMNFNFLLLDYSEDEYKCFDESYGGYGVRRRKHFNEVESCFADETDSTEPYDGSSNDDESNEEPTDDPNDLKTTGSTFDTTTTEDPSEEGGNYRPLKDAFEITYLYILFVVPVTIVGALWFWKRADIRYFCTLFRNSLILSLDKDDKRTLMMTNRKKSTNSAVIDDYQYDVFVSYSDKDRAWVLDELIPNIEKRAEINICLHERDFQVGLSILENIIQCMDKSRCLLLVVSESFLKSNWCAFEMHLAQHRLIETRREQLILVLLQDIPRSRRSRTLQFLMRTKTYIMWPTDDKEEPRLTFWKRLKKAIVLNNWEPEKMATKPRHSIV